MDKSYCENKRIVIVDDDATIRYMTRASLEQSDYDVVDFADGESALQALTSLEPDAILLDVNLPGMNGFRVCERLRGYVHCKHTPIMMLTGLTDVESINKAYQSGATDFQTKPMNWSLLAHRVKYMIRYKTTFDDLHHSRVRLLNAKNVANISDWEYNLQTGKIYWSAELFELLGLEADHSISSHHSLLQYILEEDRLVVENAIIDLFEKHINFDVEYRIINAEDQLIYVHERAQVINNSAGIPEFLSGAIQDITKRKEAEEEVHYLAYYDNLTGLANRTLFAEQLQKAIFRAKRQSLPIAVLFLNLDNFKRINDSLGHNSGDQLLKKISLKLQRDLDKYLTTDHAAIKGASPIARFGGDEFIILLEEATVAVVTRIAQRILEALGSGVNVDYHDVTLSASIGVACFPDNGLDSSTLLKNAAAAMHRAKEQGKNNFRFYDRSMNELAFRKLQLEKSLMQSIDNMEMKLFYQPIISASSDKIVGAESLIRWQHPIIGMIGPAEFIPMAEDNHFIKKIGRFVIETACQQLKSWHAKGYVDFYVTVNLSAADFSDPSLLEFIRHTLQKFQINPKCLILELTERLLMEDIEHTLNILHALKALGIKLAVDDFGTGYSSLRYLSKFPLDSLKIDQSFVVNLPHDKNDVMITEAIIGLAHSLELNIIAEGIESSQQMMFLKQNKCDYFQGYYFSKAVASEQFERLLSGQDHFSSRANNTDASESFDQSQG